MFSILEGDCLALLRTLPAGSAHTCVTSPPYWGLRDYGVAGQIGLEKSPEDYVARLVEVFREVRRVLRPDGTLWVNLGDSYATSGKGGNPPESPHQKQSTNGGSLIPGRKAPPGLKPKDLVGIPWRVAFALQSDGWYLRSDIIWAKANPMPESVTDRPTKAHEYIFLLSRSEKYYYDADAIAEPASENTHSRGNGIGIKNAGIEPGNGIKNNLDFSNAIVGYVPSRNKRSVWTVASHPYPDAHFATFPPALIEPCILAGCPEDGAVLDPFAGAGTTGLVALRLGRRFLGIELNPEYCRMARWRIQDDAPLFNQEQYSSDLTTPAGDHSYPMG